MGGGKKLDTFQTLELMSSVILAYAAMIIAIGFLFLVTYLRRHSNFKRKEFTQRIIEQNKEVKETASKIITYHATSLNPDIIWPEEEHEYSTELKIDRDIDPMFIEDIYSLVNFFNTLANGIDRGVYDEDLIRINFEQDIRLFYQYLRPYFRSLRFSNADGMFLRIEFLLKEWDNEKVKKKVTFFG